MGQGYRQQFYDYTGCCLAPLPDEVDNVMALASNIKTHTDIFQKIDAVYDNVVSILLNAAEICVPRVKKISTNTGDQKNYLYLSKMQCILTKCGRLPVSRAVVRYSISSSPADLHVSTPSGFARSKTRKLTRILMLYTMLS